MTGTVPQDNVRPDAPEGYRPGRAGVYQRVVKRIIDFVLSLLGMVALGIVCIFVAPAVKREDGGPVFYNATRVGLHGEPFKMYKFRSMKVDAPRVMDDEGSAWVGDDDPRVTRVGAFLRRTSLDEFPQVINILKGDMSFIGPRPDVPEEVALYEPSEWRRLDVLPGIGGYAQVNGRNAISIKERHALDNEYVDRISFPLDVSIFVKSITTALGGKGINES